MPSLVANSLVERRVNIEVHHLGIRIPSNLLYNGLCPAIDFVVVHFFFGNNLEVIRNLASGNPIQTITRIVTKVLCSIVVEFHQLFDLCSALCRVCLLLYLPIENLYSGDVYIL